MKKLLTIAAVLFSLLPCGGQIISDSGGSATVDNASVNTAIEEDPAASRLAMRAAMPFSLGMTKNCFGRLAATDATPLRIFLWGDSLFTFSKLTLSPRMALKGVFGNASGVYTGGAASGNGSFDYWLNGVWATCPVGGTIKYPSGGSSDVGGDTISIIYLKEPGAADSSAFTFEFSSNAGSTWTPAGVGTAKNFTADSGTDAFTSTAHGFTQGLGVRLSVSGGTLPTAASGGNLAAGTDYFIIYVDANTYKLARTPALATAATAIDLTSNGSGTMTTTPYTGIGISAVNGTTIGAVASFSVSTSNVPLYQVRVVGVAGTPKFIGYGIYYNSSTTDGVILGNGLFNLSGHNLSQELSTDPAIVTPIITALAPDLMISYCADYSWQWEEAATVLAASTTLNSPNITFPAVDIAERIVKGSEISGAGIPAGTTVLSATTTSAVLSQNATATASANLTVRGAFLTMYDIIKAADSTVDFIQIAPTPASVSADPDSDRAACVDIQADWAVANGEGFFDGYSIFGDYATGVANGLINNDDVGHVTDAGGRFVQSLFWQATPLGTMPLGRIPLLHSDANIGPHSSASEYAFTASVNSRSTIYAPFDMYMRGLSIQDAASPTTAANRMSFQASAGEGWIGMGGSEALRIGTSSFSGVHPQANGRMLGGRGSFWWNLGGAGLRLEYEAKTADYTITATDYCINVTANSPNITLPTPVALNSTTTNYTNAGAGAEGKIYVIKNTGAGTVTVIGTVDGVVNPTIAAGSQRTVQSTGTAYIEL